MAHDARTQLHFVSVVIIIVTEKLPLGADIFTYIGKNNNNKILPSALRVTESRREHFFLVNTSTTTFHLHSFATDYLFRQWYIYNEWWDDSASIFHCNLPNSLSPCMCECVCVPSSVDIFCARQFVFTCSKRKLSHQRLTLQLVVSAKRW